MQILSLPYIDQTYRLFHSIADWPYAIFLDSGNPYYPESRFDILSAQPHTLIDIKDQYTKINEKNKQWISNEDPFSLIKDLLENCDTQIPENMQHLPFTIGALGYFAYDLVRQLENLPEIAIDDIELPHAVIGIYDWSIVVDHHQKKTWLITQTLEKADLIKKKLKNDTFFPSFSLNTPFKSNLNRSAYEKAFHRIKHYIREGDCYEVNLCQRFTTQFIGSPWLAYCDWRKKCPAPYSAFFHVQNGSILSFSPERFIQVKQKKIETKPIKGTCSRSKNPEEDARMASILQNSEKDQAENLMIVDLLRNDFGKTCQPGSIQVPKLFALESFRNVHHLVSTIIGILEPQYHALDALRECFPGGSITGAPKISAMDIIEQLEPHRRSIYCGSLGYIDVRGNMDMNITIRTLICDRNNIHCYAGGAITSDSSCEEEYQETLKKVAYFLS